MKCGLLPIFAMVGLAGLASGKMVFEFDGESWDPDPAETPGLAKIQEEVCFVAPAEMPMGDLAELLTLVNRGGPRKLKFQLQRQPKSVTVDRPPFSFRRSIGPFGVVPPGPFVSVTTGADGTSLAIHDRPGIEGETWTHLGPDLAGIRRFLELAAAGFEPADGGKRKSIPSLSLMARSDGSFGQLVTVLQLLKQSGCVTASIIIDDEIPHLSGGIGQDRKRRIVVNIDAKGRVSAEDDTPLSEDEDITRYLQTRKKEILASGLRPGIHIHASSKSLFVAIRRVIGLAAELDLTEVVFASLGGGADADPEDVENLNLALPAADPDGEGNQLSALLVTVASDGAVGVNSGPAKEDLDRAAAGRDLPLLSQRIEIYVAAATAMGAEPLVHLHVAGDAKQKRLVDVLNVFAKFKITKVTMMHLEGDE